MTSPVSLSNRIAAGITAFRSAGTPRTATPTAAQPQAVPEPQPQKTLSLRAGIPGEGDILPRGSYVNILV